MHFKTRIALMAALVTLLATVGCGEVQPSADKPDKEAPESNDTPDVADNTPCRPNLSPLPPSGEGMWPWDGLCDLDEDALKKRGLKIPLKDLWTPGVGGLARAAVGLRGCSASFVSKDGLMITNHHCAFAGIQRNSTPENNLLETGFLANDRTEELDGHGLRAFVFMKQTEITEQILRDMPKEGSDLERIELIEVREKAAVKECEKKPNTRCRVSRNNDGLEFILLENLELKDVRLVALPPQSLGEFGGEVDNWQWPRHTMDFTFVRAYVDKDGKPAEYSKDNVPYKPEAHFKVGVGGVSPGDLVMVVGTPYRTARYRTLASVRRDLEWYYPTRLNLFTEWNGVMEKVCADVPESCLPTTGMVKSLNNALTNARGMITGLERKNILEKKAKQEKEWQKWVAKEPERAARWGTALDDLTGYLEKSDEGRDRNFLIRYILWGNKLVGFARTITKWHSEQLKPDEEREPGFQDRDRDNTLDDLRQAQRSLDPEADRRILAMFLGRLGKLPQSERIATFETALRGDYGEASIKRFVDRLYRGSRLLDVSVREDLFNAKMDRVKGSTDSAIKLAWDMAQEFDAYDDDKKARNGAFSRLRPPYIESLVEMRGAAFYPDANASPRISFATVAGYSPRDGVWHTPLTTLSGLLAKVTDKKPFNAPDNVVKAIRDKRLPFADDKLGDVPVCFLSNADTTGGNSGSPALDANGRLVGLNFDRVYENISGDYGYNPSLSRNIMVEIRSVLWYLDAVIGADNIQQELGVK